MRTLAIFGAVFAFALAFAPTCALQGCALHHQVPVDPNYPPPTPFEGARDAGKDAP